MTWSARRRSWDGFVDMAENHSPGGQKNSGGSNHGLVPGIGWVGLDGEEKRRCRGRWSWILDTEAASKADGIGAPVRLWLWRSSFHSGARWHVTKLLLLHLQSRT